MPVQSGNAINRRFKQT